MADSLDDDARDRVADVFSTHQRFVESVARNHAPNPADVDDIVQNVGMKLCTSLHDFRNESKVRTWLYRVTVNAARDLYRHEHGIRARNGVAFEPLPDTDLNIADPSTDLDEHLIQQQRTDAIQDAIERLPMVCQRAIRNETRRANVPMDNRTKLERWRAMRALRDAAADDPRLEG